MMIISQKLIFFATVAATYVQHVQNLLIDQDENMQGSEIKTTLGDSHFSKQQLSKFLNHKITTENNKSKYRLDPKDNIKKLRVRRGIRKSKKNKKAYIHVVPVMKTPYPLSGGFDLHGNIQCNWTAKSMSNMKLYVDSPLIGSKSGSVEAYIGIKYTRNYFIYGQVFFHANNSEMGHCLYVADAYKRPCDSPDCRERPVMCSRSAPGHPENKTLVENYNTNYIGGVVRLKRGSTIRLGVLASHHKDMTRSVKIDNSACYFGAFAVS